MSGTTHSVTTSTGEEQGEHQTPVWIRIVAGREGKLIGRYEGKIVLFEGLPDNAREGYGVQCELVLNPKQTCYFGRVLYDTPSANRPNMITTECHSLDDVDREWAKVQKRYAEEILAAKALETERHQKWQAEQQRLKEVSEAEDTAMACRISGLAYAWIMEYRKHDRYYDYSDDGQVWKRGKEQADELDRSWAKLSPEDKGSIHKELGSGHGWFYKK